jgi:hypothetical protein
MIDLFGFISEVVSHAQSNQTFITPPPSTAITRDEARTTPFRTETNKNRTVPSLGEDLDGEVEVKPEELHSPFLPITPEWLSEQHPDLLTRMATIWNSMRESEGLTSLENAEAIPARQLVKPLSESRSQVEAHSRLLDRCRDLESFAHRLYGDIAHQDQEEIPRRVNVLMENALRQPYEDEEVWLRQVIEVAVRKVLADQTKGIYTRIVVSALQQPFREIVRQCLQADEIPFPEQVLAEAREKRYLNTMRASLQTLARLGLTAQTTALAWQAARSGQSENALTPWLARRVDGALAAIWEGYAILEHRVVRTLGYALLATFDADKHITHQLTIAEADIERAQQSLLAQGFRCGERAYVEDNRVVKLWCEFCRGRDSGWWFGDEARRVMVVIPYLMRRRLSHHKPLCRAVSQMQVWGYRFFYDDHALYFLPSGVELPADTFRNGDVAEHKGGA